MVPENQQSPLISTKLYIYGMRQSDQFWLPDQRSYSRKPYCLTDLTQFQIKDDQDEENSKIIPNPLLNKVIYKIACGGLHSVVLTNQGEVYTFGCNDQGALGRQGTECIPIKVQLQDPIDMISAGDNHSIFANSQNGAIYTTGNYNYLRGQKMKEQSVRIPQRIYAQQINIANKNKKIQKITSGANHNCILIGGKIFCRGQPQALTIGRRSSKRHKIQNSLTFNGVNLSHIVDMQCGGYHTVAKVKKRNSLYYYAWGTNTSGQLGINSYQSQVYPVQIKKLRDYKIKQISAGTNFTLFLSEQGQLYGCGTNQYGHLGLGQNYEYQSQQQMEEQRIQRQVQELKLDNKQENQNKDNKQEEGQQKNQQEKNNNNVQQKQIPKQKSEEPQIQQNNQEQKRLNLQKNVYIKNVKKIQIPQPITNIGTGCDCSFAWNSQNLYTWGFATGYILLNGSQQQQYQPFRVKPAIINNHIIHSLQAGGQHAMFLSHPKQLQVQLKQDPKFFQNLTSCRRLKRKK